MHFTAYNFCIYIYIYKIIVCREYVSIIDLTSDHNDSDQEVNEELSASHSSDITCRYVYQIYTKVPLILMLLKRGYSVVFIR